MLALRAYGTTKGADFTLSQVDLTKLQLHAVSSIG